MNELPPGISDEAENLDDYALDPGELDAWADEHPDAHKALRLYARTKAKAMRARLAGDIALATSHEDSCEWLYEHRIPERLRW